MIITSCATNTSRSRWILFFADKMLPNPMWQLSSSTIVGSPVGPSVATLSYAYSFRLIELPRLILGARERQTLLVKMK